MPDFIAKNKEINFLHPDSQRIFRNLIESVRSGIYMADVQGTLFYVNPAFVNILGYNHKEEVLGLNLPSQIYPNPKAAKYTTKVFRALVAVMTFALTGTLLLGIILAFKTSRVAWPVWLALGAGILVPAALLWWGQKT